MLKERGRPRRRAARRLMVGLLVAALILGSGWVAYGMAVGKGLDNLAQVANARLSLLKVTLDATVERYDYLPTVVAQAEVILDLYREPTPQAAEAASRYLRSLADVSGASDLFIVDDNGVTLATSNYLDKNSFLGRNYAFRPYFKEGLRKSDGRYYAVGATTGKPGYFLWHSVSDEDGRTLGVAVVKVDLIALQEDWKSTDSSVAIVDRNGVIFLTNQAGWQYRPISPLTSQQLHLLRESRQYGVDTDNLNPLFESARTERHQQVVRIGEGARRGREYVIFSSMLPSDGWTMVVLFQLRSVKNQAATLAAAVMLALLAAALIFLATHQRRQMIRAKLNAHEVLERRVRERTAELAATNDLLSAEIQERIRAEQDLERAQAHLIHATKMASLGQALAGVAHEINQSLAALTTYVAGARVLLERGEKSRVLSNLDLITSIAHRMGVLTQHLKSFARKDTVSKQITDFAAAVRSAVALIEYRFADEHIEATLEIRSQPVFVHGNAVRLEQVVVNLLSNALDAMRGEPRRKLCVALATRGESAILTVADTGRGIPRENLSSIFDPFYTTKEVGQGLGLGLSISYGIIRDMGGEIAVESELGARTVFRVTLPVPARQTSPALQEAQ